MLKDEMAQLRQLVRQHESRRGEISKELEKARQLEGEERRRLEESRITEQEKRLKLRARFQSAVRSVVREQRAMAAIATPSPDLVALGEQLEDQLYTLHHSLHSLKYGPVDREQGATKLQGWWRCILAKRVARCLRINCAIWRLRDRMVNSAVKIQSWYRGLKIRRKWQETLRQALRKQRKSDEIRLQNQIRVVRVLQKAIRVYLARRRLVRSLEAGPQLLRESTDDSHSKNSRYVDNWRPAAEKRLLRERPPPEDRELAKMEEAGLIPFYSNVATNTIRHRIGGPHALKIQYQLGVGVGSHLNRHFEDAVSETSPRSTASPRASKPLDAPKEVQAEVPGDLQTERKEEANPVSVAAEARESEIKALEDRKSPKLVRPFMFKGAAELLRDDLGGNWDIYPQGLSDGLLKSLAFDMARAPKKPSKTKPKRKPLTCTKPLEALPMRTEQRAAAREAAQAEADELEAKLKARAAVAHLEHPMLESLLPLPNVPMHPRQPTQPKPPPGPPPGRARPGLILYKDQEDCSWADATSFYHEGSRRHGRSTEGWRNM